MPTTNIYGVTYPASSALVTDGATAMQTISTGFDTAVQKQASAIYGRNLIDNPEFAINYRNNQTITAGTLGYVCDRWTWSQTSASATNTLITTTTIGNPGPPAEGILSQLGVNVSSSTGATAEYYISQKLYGGLAKFSGQRVQISFYASCALANKQVGIRVVRRYGTGGSPTADAASATQYSGAISAAGQRYSFTFDIPDLTGNVIGSSNDDSLELQIFFTSGSSGGAPSLANQTNSGVGNDIYLTGVQAEYDYLTLYEQRNQQQDALRCARYFQTSYTSSWLLAGGAGAIGVTGVVEFSGSSDASGFLALPIRFPVPMQRTPTIRFYTNSTGAVGSWDYARSAGTGVVAMTTRTSSLSVQGFTAQNSATVGATWAAAKLFGQWAASIDAW